MSRRKARGKKEIATSMGGQVSDGSASDRFSRATSHFNKVARQGGATSTPVLLELNEDRQRPKEIEVAPLADTTPASTPFEEDERQAENLQPTYVADIRADLRNELADAKNAAAFLLIAIGVALLIGVWQITSSQATELRSDIRDLRSEYRRDMERVQDDQRAVETRLRNVEDQQASSLPEATRQ